MSSESPQSLAINSEFIELCHLLKFAGLVTSGGEGKEAVAQGLVQVNGELESRKRRKVRPGDIVEFRGARLRVTEANP